MDKDINLLVQDYLASYMGRDCLLHEGEELACNVFDGAIHYAYIVFGNRLMLGGAYSVNEDDKTKILDHLDGIRNVLKKYTNKD